MNPLETSVGVRVCIIAGACGFTAACGRLNRASAFGVDALGGIMVGFLFFR